MKNYAFDAPDFVRADDVQPIHWNSLPLQALPATSARQSNCTQEEIETYGWWQAQGMYISMRYGSMSLPYQDAKVASKLCVGGPVK